MHPNNLLYELAPGKRMRAASITPSKHRRASSFVTAASSAEQRLSMVVQRTSRRHQVQTAWLAFAIASGFSSYLVNMPKLPAYSATLIGLAGILIYGRCPVTRMARNMKWLVVAFAFATAITMTRLILFAPDMLDDLQDVLQVSAYPIVAGLLLFSFRSGVAQGRPALFYLAAAIGLAQAIVASANSLIGPLTIPGVGELVRGRAIFFSGIESSAGVLANVNYYAATQVMLFWLAMATRRQTRLTGTVSGMICAIILISSLLGSSRGATLAAIVSLYVYWTIRHSRSGARMIFGIAVFSLLAYGAVSLVTSSDDVQSAIRVHKGLNGRDVRWESAMDAIAEHPWLGMGLEVEVEASSSAVGSAQNTLIMSLLRVGVLGSVPWILLVLFCLVRSVRCKVPAWAPCAVVVWLIDGTVRVYSLGGIGLIPMIAALGLAEIIATPSTGTPSTVRKNQKQERVAGARVCN